LADSKKNILIVEDELPLTRALEIKLTRADFVVQVTHNGQEAMDALSNGKFDLIVLDLIMPIMDGFKFMENVAGKSGTPDILVLSNLSQVEDIEKAKRLGAFDFLVKSNASLQNIVDYITAHFNNGN
jgi:DNA-binding response OmpR family regulator